MRICDNCGRETAEGRERKWWAAQTVAPSARAASGRRVTCGRGGVEYRKLAEIEVWVCQDCLDTRREVFMQKGRRQRLFFFAFTALTAVQVYALFSTAGTGGEPNPLLLLPVFLMDLVFLGLYRGTFIRAKSLDWLMAPHFSRKMAAAGLDRAWTPENFARLRRKETRQGFEILDR